MVNFKALDFNYWNNGSKNGDCVIRALCATTGFGYKKICDMLGVGDQFNYGTGYGWSAAHGIDRKQMDAFISKTEMLELIWEDDMFSAWADGHDKEFDLQDVTAEDTLEYFVENFLPIVLDEKGIDSENLNFVVEVRSNSARKSGDSLNIHMVALRKRGQDWTIIDNAKNQRVVNTIPNRVYLVKKFCSKDSKFYYPTEREAVMTSFAKELQKNKKGSAAKQ